MNRRGFTLLELLVALGVAAIMLGMLAKAMRSEGRSALFTLGTDDMQQNVRGALDLFQREVRMAGYRMNAVPPAVLPAIDLPATADLYAVNLRGNYDGVQSRGTAAAGTPTITLDVTAAPFPAFTPGERVAIESLLLGVAEVRTVSAYAAGTGTITLDANLANDYEAGSPVVEINEFTYRLDANNVLWRDGVIVADQVSALQLQYVLEDGTHIANPGGTIENLRSATIRMHAQQPEYDGLQAHAELNTEVRIRNLGIVRSPAVGS